MSTLNRRDFFKGLAATAGIVLVPIQLQPDVVTHYTVPIPEPVYPIVERNEFFVKNERGVWMLVGLVVEMRLDQDPDVPMYVVSFEDPTPVRTQRLIDPGNVVMTLLSDIHGRELMHTSFLSNSSFEGVLGLPDNARALIEFKTVAIATSLMDHELTNEVSLSLTEPARIVT